MRGTKELGLRCWLGPAELVNFIKRQINVRKGWSALGDVALPLWLGLGLCTPQTPVLWLRMTGAVPAQLVWVLAQRNWLQRWTRGKPCPRVSTCCWSSRAGTALTACSSPSPCSSPPCRHQGSSPESTRTQLFHLSVNLLHVLAFTAIQTFSRPHPWKVVAFQQLLISTLMDKVFKKLLQKLWMVLKGEQPWICSYWIQYYSQLWKNVVIGKKGLSIIHFCTRWYWQKHQYL